MAEIKLQKKLIYAGDVWVEILKEDPKLVYILDRIKPVDAVEVVHGRWEKHEATGFMGCSNCWDVFVDKEWLTEGRWNYCPNCGAKMDGEREDNGSTQV